jgi:uncharacterized cysteine cluster protein YcgN (CxxCxxCC family)
MFAIVAIAAAYLARKAYRRLTAPESASGCGGCGKCARPALITEQKLITLEVRQKR